MNFKITILGSSGALPAYGRHPSAQLVEIQNKYFLVDCGEGAQIQLMRFGVNFHRIDHVLISHLHGDHYLGLMGLLFTMHLQRRTNPLHIYSYSGLDEIIIAHLRHSLSALSFLLHFHPLERYKDALIFEDDTITVSTIPLKHKLKCSGFLFREKPKLRRIDKSRLPPGLLIRQIAGLKRGEDVLDQNGNILYRNEDLTFPPRKSRSYAYCSDTAFDERIVEHIRAVDVLYHEATFTEDEAQKASDTLHSTARSAGEIARLSGVQRLFVGHFSARYKDLTPLLDEARSVFDNTSLALEGEEIIITD